MKCSDYIVNFLAEKEITDVFGYPGGMVTALMDSLSRCQSIASHLMYHEQGASFAACGYAQASGKMAVAYATSGPGATNLITGICNAYFDSVPVLFLTGQVNSNECKDGLPVRQRGFQETDIVSMISPVTKYAVRVDRAEDLPYHLEMAYYLANHQRKGPVLLDIPMNVFRTDIEPKDLNHFTPPENDRQYNGDLSVIPQLLSQAKRPVFLLGNGIKISHCEERFRKILKQYGVPVVTTMLAVDVLPDPSLNYGFLGAYGSRIANFIVSKCDLLISIGARLDVRQVGANRSAFAPNAKLVRVDIDPGELEYGVKADEVRICADVSDVATVLSDTFRGTGKTEYRPWIETCDRIRRTLDGYDDRLPNLLTRELGKKLPKRSLLVTDVGQNQIWVAQSFPFKEGDQVLFSGGHGAMGYSLPAAIGAYYATGKPTVSLNGDGGIQMNLQELMTIARDRLPIKVVVFNNHALGMIRHFQEMYYSKNYTQTTVGHGYADPDFKGIAQAYHMPYCSIETAEDFQNTDIFETEGAALIEIKLDEETYVYPKLEYGKPNQDQEPLLPRELYCKLMELGEEKENNRMSNRRSKSEGGGVHLNRSEKIRRSQRFLCSDKLIFGPYPYITLEAA